MSKAVSKYYPEELYIFDADRIEPGNLVRHEASPQQVGQYKVDAMVQQIGALFEGRCVKGFPCNIVSNWQELVERTKDHNLILDLTGSLPVHELVKCEEKYRSSLVVWGYITPGPAYGLLVLRSANSKIGIFEAEEELSKNLDEDAHNSFLEARNSPDKVWPEPGCYHPTFRAPFHRVRMMADVFLTTLESWVNSGASASVVTLFRQCEQQSTHGMETTIVAQIQL